MRSRKTILIWVVIIVFTGNVVAQLNGAFEFIGEYDGNAYNDSYGGDTMVGTAYLDLNGDIDLKLAGMLLGADYSGSYSAYLSFLGINQNNHLGKLLLWRKLGRDGYFGLGTTYSLQINAGDRSSYDINNLKLISEIKTYLAQPVLLKLDGALGEFNYANLPNYDFSQLFLNGSISLFLPSRTGLALSARLKQYDFAPQAIDSQVPRSIVNVSSGIMISQSIANNAGLSVEDSYLRNRVNTTISDYMPDTLLHEVNEYFDYTGGRLGAKLTVKMKKGAKISLSTDYTKLKFSSLQAYSLPIINASILTRQSLAELRQDEKTVLGLDYTAPISELEKNKANIKLGVLYTMNTSNDELYDFKKTIMYAGINFNF